MSETLQVSGIVAGYIPDLPVLRDVSLSAQKGRITVIIGPNGAGKSTLIKAVSGLVPVTGGQVALNGADITNPRPDQMSASGVAYIPQTDNIFRSLTIRQNLELVLRNAGSEGPARLDRLFQQFPPLAEKQRERAGSLSGGQRQFLAIAMALAIDPSLILMDEPSAGLSPKAAEEVLEHARALAQRGVTILLVEQNVKQALRLADHCYILADGRNQIDGPAADLLSDPVVGQIYLGGKRMAPA
ncbi:ABC transporter ATP-binding protein [Roseobacter sp. EG26]|uniref:ABC transporter ATP-binding protein n=1 Tax=Roseobacter sp. EG26 TaxID=3412477 RepID=UPI003CE5C68A